MTHKHRCKHAFIFTLGPRLFHEFMESIREVEEHVEDAKFTNYHVEELPEEYRVYIEMPGVNKEDIEAYANSSRIYVKAKPSKELPWGRREYRVKLRFQSEIDPETIKAKYENGILTLRVPKRIKGKKISIE